MTGYAIEAITPAVNGDPMKEQFIVGEPDASKACQMVSDAISASPGCQVNALQQLLPETMNAWGVKTGQILRVSFEQT